MKNENFALPPRYQALPGLSMAGGYGTVEAVQDTFLDRQVLLKYMQDKQNNAQLINEIQGLSKARSRHVVEIYDVIKDTEGMVVGIIIEYLTGRDYHDFHTELHAKPLEYLRILYQIATALADLHHAGIVHRDLKLENLKASASGLLKIFDFGLASANSDYHTSANRGTLVYAAPELYVPNAAITKEMDVYAFGICAWKLASSLLPQELSERPPQRSGRAASITTALGNLLPPEISQLIDDCIHPDPSQRPTAQTCSKLLAKYLVQGKHRGIFVSDATPISVLNNTNNTVHLKVGSLGKISIHYDSLSFRIVAVEGTVLINNMPASLDMPLPDSCVLTFGEYSLGPGRRWVSFSSSHPGVVI